MSRRVVITGLGVVSPLGNDITTFYSRLMAGQSGIKHLQLPFVDRLSARIGAQISDFDPSAHFSKMQLSGMERFSQFALVAAAQAVADAGMELAESERARAGVCMGSCMGGAGTLEDGYTEVMQRDTPRVKPLSVLLSMNNAAASHISIKDTLNKPRFSGADQAYLDFQGNIPRILLLFPAIGAFPGDSSPILLTQDGLLPPEVFPIYRD